MTAPHAATIVAAAIQGALVGFGLFGNALVIFVYVLGRDKQDTSAVIYILNLAVADFLYLLTVPFSISTEVRLEWIFGDAMCKIGALALYLNFLVSPLFLMVMSIDRCVSVYRAVSSSTMRSTRVAKRVSIGVWVVGFAVVTGPAMLFQVSSLSKCEPIFPGKPRCDFVTFDACLYGDVFVEETEGVNMTWTTSQKTKVTTKPVTDERLPWIPTSTLSPVNSSETIVDQCIREVCPDYNPAWCMTPKSHSFRLWVYVSFVLNYFLPCAVIVICYAALLRHIYQPSAISTSTSSGGGLNDERKKRATLVVALLVLTYFVCFTPYYVWNVLLNVGVDVAYPRVCSHMRRIVLTLSDLNSTLNPMLYPFIGNQFRAKFNLALRRLRRKTRNSTLGTMNRVSLRRLRTGSNRNRTLRENVYNDNNYITREADEQQLIGNPEAREGAMEKTRSAHGQTSNGSGAATTHSSASNKASATPQSSSGCLSCFKHESYVCPECAQEDNGFKSNEDDVIDEVNQSSLKDNEEMHHERAKLCKKHRNSEAPSSVVATAKHSRGGWRYASSLKSESKFTTEVSSVEANL